MQKRALGRHLAAPRRRPAKGGQRGARPAAAAQFLAGRLDPDLVRQLQQDVGNRAVTLAIQRQPAPGKTVATTSANRPKHGADVRAALRTQLPGLLGALTEDQITRWQRVVDYYAISRHVQREADELHAGYKRRYPELEPTGIGEYNAERARIVATMPPKPEGGDKLAVDPRLLLADDVHAAPEWDVAAETAFRLWAVAELAKSPPVFDMYPERNDEIVTRRTSLGTFTTKGLITLGDLHQRFLAQHRARVTHRPEWTELRRALYETQVSYSDATQAHRERSDINKANKGWFGFDVVRNIIEASGRGSEDYPTIRIWDEPKQLLDKAAPLLRDQKYELAVPLVAMAELATAQAANRIFAYDRRVETGAHTVVKWLERVKDVGSIAAGIAAGPLGISGSALVAGGYTFLQEGAQNASAVVHGQRTDLGLVSLLKKAGIATAMAALGGVLQTRFNTALGAYLKKVTGHAGGAIRDMGISAASAAFSSVYTTAVETTLGHVIEGKAFPRNAAEFAHLITDNALQATVMDVALRGPSARAAREYQAWKVGRAGTVLSTAGRTGNSGTKGAHAAPEPSRMPEDVVRRLLQDSGGWVRLSAELHAGSGLGHGLMPAERRALLDRFEASRELLARDVGGMFEGTVLVAETGAGRQIEVRFLGEEAARHLAEARAYLDVKHPGWEAQTALTLQGGSRAVAGGPRAQQAAAALEHATPEARRMAARLAPLYENWSGLRTDDRLYLLLGVVNEHLRALGVPEVDPGLGTQPGEDGHMNAKDWELQISVELLRGHTQTPEQFAYVCGIAMHEAHHAVQMFRAARTNPQLAMAHVSKPVVEAAVHANEGKIPAEHLHPASLEYAEAAAARESMWNSGTQKRAQVYGRLTAAGTAMASAIANARSVRGEARGSPIRDVAARDLWAAREEQNRAHDEYMRLPEEVGAWRTGRETQAAVKERLRLDRLIATARVADRAALARYEAVEDSYLAAVLDRSRPLPASTVRAWEKALREFSRANDLLRKLETRRIALATTGVPP